MVTLLIPTGVFGFVIVNPKTSSQERANESGSPYLTTTTYRKRKFRLGPSRDPVLERFGNTLPLAQGTPPRSFEPIGA